MSNVTKPIVLDESFNAGVEKLHGDLSEIAMALGAGGSLDSWEDIQYAVRKGIISKYLLAGDQLNVILSETASAAVEGTGITAASVVKDTFIAANGSATGVFVFTHENGAWHHNGEAVSLTTYGITPTGTAVDGDAIYITVTGTSKVFDVEGIDEEISVRGDDNHVLSIQMHQVFNSQNFDPAQFLFAVTAAACTAFGWNPATGMPAGKYKITLDHGAYGGGTGQDATYVFTTTQAVPVGGGVRHSVMGEYQKVKSDVLAGTFTTYGADKVTTVETTITTSEYNSSTDSDAVDLGTATAQNPTYKIGDYINFTERQRYGSNRWSTSWLRQYLNSADAELAWTPGTIWSRPISTSIEGFLHLLDPALKAVLTKVRKRYALQTADGGGYEDVEDYVTLDTMMDVFGGKNNNIYEGPVDSNGAVVRSSQMSLWKNINTTQASRIKRNSSNTASIWWLGSMHPDIANGVRNVSTSGALDSLSGAYSSSGVVPRLHIS